MVRICRARLYLGCVFSFCPGPSGLGFGALNPKPGFAPLGLACIWDTANWDYSWASEDIILGFRV